MSNLEIIGEVDTKINTKELRKNTLRKVYEKQVPNLKILSKIKWILDKHRLLKSMIATETKREIKKYMVRSALEDAFVLIEPIDLTIEEYNELMYKIKCMEKIREGKKV